jgi:chromosome segregation ATPase
MTRKRISAPSQGNQLPAVRAGAAIRAAGDSVVHTALEQVRRDLSVSLPLLRETAESLSKDILDASQQLNEERAKLRLLNNKVHINARLASLTAERQALEREMKTIEEQEWNVLNPKRFDVKDLLAIMRIDQIIETQDPTIIRSAIILCETILAGATYTSTPFSTSKLHTGGTPDLGMGYKAIVTSSKKQYAVYPRELENAKELLTSALSELMSMEQPLIYSEARSSETLAQRLERNEIYQRLRAKRDGLLESIAETTADLESLKVYMEQWQHIVRQKQGWWKRKFTKLTNAEVEAEARTLCETSIKELQERLLSLHQQKNEILTSLQQEESEIRAPNGTIGDGK